MCTTNIKLVTQDGDDYVLEYTEKCCWNDTYPINGLPFPLIDSEIDDELTVIGMFCSINCALAYNLRELNDSNVSRRKSLTYKFYRYIYDIDINTELNFVIAKPRIILEKYTGNKTISQYRKKLKIMGSDYIIYTPPLKPSNIIIEDMNRNSNNNCKYILERKSSPVKKNLIMEKFMSSNY